jgi:diaminohydroxyphosphoribosylaminopyrimidine deaminase/5-amino-6-(5-phosphoribosylamino)uracil reductase
MMRTHADAVLVGISTVLADDPWLNVRLPGLEERSPVRVVLDSHLRLPSSSRLSATAARFRSWVVCSEAAPDGEEARLVTAGFEVIRVAAGPSGRVDLAAALLCLGARGLTRVFCEGGPTLAGALGEADLVDELVLITGAADLSVRVGAALEATPALQADLAAALRTRFRLVETEQVGPDTIQTFERIASCLPAL